MPGTLGRFDDGETSTVAETNKVGMTSIHTDRSLNAWLEIVYPRNSNCAILMLPGVPQQLGHSPKGGRKPLAGHCA
jgi:hypothetical protein